jgi:RNA polymerase sigma-70 factor, ECF subfamily
MADKARADRKDFENIALPYLDTVFRAAVMLCGHNPDAEDLAQTAFMKAFERFDTFELGTDCKGWLMRILRNTWIDKLRQKAVAGLKIALDETVLAQPQPPDLVVWSDAEDLLENFSDEVIIRAMKELSDEQRLTLFLIDVERMNINDAADILGVAPGTVKSRSSRARIQLKEKLAAHAKDLGYSGRQK